MAKKRAPKSKKTKPKKTKKQKLKAVKLSIIVKGAKGSDLATGLRVISAIAPAVEHIARVTSQSAWSIQGKLKRKTSPDAIIPQLAMHSRPFDIDPPLRLAIGVELTDKSFAPLAWQDSRNLAEALIEFEVNGTKLELRYSNGNRV